MSKLPVTDAKVFEKIPMRFGFMLIRQKGSHKFSRHPDGRYTTVPFHGNDDLGRPLIREILKQIELSPEEYLRLLNEL